MKRSALVAAVVMVAGCGHMPGAEKESGWVTLLDASSLGNWNRAGNANWRVADGVVVADKGVGFLVTKDTYGDFELRAEFYVEADTNSGIYFRCQDPKAPANPTCYEANIYDTRAVAEYGTGAFTNQAKVSDPKPKAGGRWNTYHLTVKGDYMVLVMNGQKTAESRDAKHARGFIALQHDKGVKGDTSPVKFRKVEIKPL